MQRGTVQPKVDAELYYVIDEKNNQIELSDKGVDYLSGTDDPNFFVMPEMGMEISKIESQNLEPEKEAELKEELFREFEVKSERIHTMNQLLKAYAKVIVVFKLSTNCSMSILITRTH